MTPKISFIIVSFNTRELLDRCLASIRAYTQDIAYEVIVVDNASRDGSPRMVREKYPEAILIQSAENLGFGRANNLGFKRSRAPFVMLLNSDALLQESTAAPLVKFLERKRSAGIVSPDVVLLNGERQTKTRGMLPSARVMLNQNMLLSRLFPASQFFAGLYVEADWGQETRIGWVSGVCMVIRREVYDQTGGFDPGIFMYAEDVDLCRRAHDAGWETWRVNAHAVKHLCGGSTKTHTQMLRNRVLQQRNFIKLLDRSMGPFGRLATRASLVGGLILRVIIRGVYSFTGAEEAQLSFHADVRCFADFVGIIKVLPGDSYAHRN